jgi:hypothetical protein
MEALLDRDVQRLTKCHLARIPEGYVAGSRHYISGMENREFYYRIESCGCGSGRRPKALFPDSANWSLGRETVRGGSEHHCFPRDTLAKLVHFKGAASPYCFAKERAQMLHE